MDHNRRRARLVLVVPERASEARPDPEDVEEGCAGHRRLHLFGLVGCQGAPEQRPRSHAVERPALSLNVEKVRKGERQRRVAVSSACRTEQHESIGTGPEARSPRHVQITEGGAVGSGVPAGEWRVRQALADPEGWYEWNLVARVDLEASREEGRAVMVLESLSSVA